jgi:hypothetical protein
MKNTKDNQKMREIIQKESGWCIVKLLRLKAINPRKISFWGSIYTFDNDCNLLSIVKRVT